MKKTFIALILAIMVIGSSVLTVSALSDKTDTSYKSKVGVLTVSTYSEDVYAAISDDYVQQVVDDKNSALVQNWCESIIIGDHNYQGLSVLSKISVGDTAALEIDGVEITLTAINVSRHTLPTDFYIFSNQILTYTCEAIGKDDIVVVWEIETSELTGVDLQQMVDESF